MTENSQSMVCRPPLISSPLSHATHESKHKLIVIVVIIQHITLARIRLSPVELSGPERETARCNIVVMIVVIRAMLKSKWRKNGMDIFWQLRAVSRIWENPRCGEEWRAAKSDHGDDEGVCDIDLSMLACRWCIRGLSWSSFTTPAHPILCGVCVFS